MTGKVNGKKLAFGSEQELPTRADWDAASAFAKGYATYMFAEHPGSEIPKQCPYKAGTREYDEFQSGQRCAMLAAQDSEE